MDTFLSFLRWILEQAAIPAIAVVLLYKLIDHRFSRHIAAMQAEMGVKAHRSNIVFSRLDKERASAIQDIDTALGVFNWHYIEFTPRSPLMHVGNTNPLAVIAIAWSIKLGVLAKEVLQTTLRNSLLLDDNLMLPLAAWYHVAHQVASEYTGEFCKLMADPAYKAMDVEQQRSALVAVSERSSKQLLEGFQRVSADVKARLKAEFQKIKYDE